MIKILELKLLKKQSKANLERCEIISEGTADCSHAKILKDGDQYFLWKKNADGKESCFETAVD